LKAPFPYFGGKSKVADTIWGLLGADVTNYVEPFAGSLAVLLNRPGGAGKVETVNDYDGLLANAWRAMQHDPEAVAEYADWPVNECDLHARHLWLIGQREALTERLMGDPNWYDAKAAGWWVWGACAWIGSGWCSGKGPWVSADGVLTRTGNAGQGINRKMPHVGDAGRCDYIREIFTELSERLRNVRVVCGDFERVLGPSTTTRHGLTGVFLDPPYEADNHDPYHAGSSGVSARARDWAMKNGYDPLLRIVLSGYDGEHDMLEMWGWTKHSWKAHGGYGSQGNSRGRDNAHREVLWVSPR
jgi:site-specific DNA-adenine methylase